MHSSWEWLVFLKVLDLQAVMAHQIKSRGGESFTENYRRSHV
jgi:hypothetical protein